MRLRVFLILSAALNIFLLAAWLNSKGNAERNTKVMVPDVDKITFNRDRVKTNTVMRRQNFSWREVESGNYLSYIENLRSIGCPDSTIRDIIVADVNELYAHRRASEIVPADHQWWRSEPDMDLVQSAADKIKTLDTERRALLTRLLGANWERSNNPVPPAVRTGVSLTGPILGELSPEQKQAVYDITARSQLRLNEYGAALEKTGQRVDELELFKIQQEARQELGKVLSPEAMEEFLLRYSPTAVAMRNELRGMDLSPEEFKAFFRARDFAAQQPAIHYAGEDAAKMALRQELEAQREAAVAQAIGKERYAAYKLNQEPLFQSARESAEQAEAPPDRVIPIYQVNQVTSAEKTRVANDASLSSGQRIEALNAIEAERQKSLQKILGSEGFQRLQRSANP